MGNKALLIANSLAKALGAPAKPTKKVSKKPPKGSPEEECPESGEDEEVEEKALKKPKAFPFKKKVK